MPVRKVRKTLKSNFSVGTSFWSLEINYSRKTFSWSRSKWNFHQSESEWKKAKTFSRYWFPRRESRTHIYPGSIAIPLESASICRSYSNSSKDWKPKSWCSHLNVLLFYETLRWMGKIVRHLDPDFEGLQSYLSKASLRKSRDSNDKSWSACDEQRAEQAERVCYAR